MATTNGKAAWSLADLEFDSRSSASGAVSTVKRACMTEIRLVGVAGRRQRWARYINSRLKAAVRVADAGLGAWEAYSPERLRDERSIRESGSLL